MVVRFIIFAAILILAIASVPFASDPPHTPDLNVTCASCHNPSITFTYITIDNTPWNEVCWGCHDFGMSGSRFESDTHSAISTRDEYWGGSWTNECRSCHDPHTNEQARAYQGAYPTGAWLYTGTIQSSTYNTITVSGSPWADDELIGKTLHPKAGGSYLYRIVDNTSNTIVVAGSMFPFTRMAGGTFAISYGKLIRAEVNTGSYADKFRTVKFLNSSGSDSFADGNEIYDGICEVCHNLPSHFRRDGSGPDQIHANLGGKAGTDCIACHMHEDGFAHFNGKDCSDCHGHDNGFGGMPYYGSTQSHSTHTENDADDLRGPNIACAECHDTNNYPFFKDGQNLTNTNICDNCHSQGGLYDGVNDPTIGAKNNWSEGVYDVATLRPGKEKWCAGCHDDDPANSKADDTGIDAPNIVYDSYWGVKYYVSGHKISCTNCHDPSYIHLEAVDGTYVFRQSTGQVWGDDPNEKMSQYIADNGGIYQPLRFNSTDHASATYYIYHDHTTRDRTDQTRNQEINGGEWISLGTYPFDGLPGILGDDRIAMGLRHTTTGTIIADAIKLVRIEGGVPVEEMIVDNADGTPTSGTWILSNTESGYYGTDYHYNIQNTPGLLFTWTPTITTPGTYEVFARWTTRYEPDALNQTDYITFCTDCHNETNTMYSSTFDRNLYSMDWSVEKHGCGAALDNAALPDEIGPPYEQAQLGNYVLSCIDCHVPHANRNNLLIRTFVNFGDVRIIYYGAGSDIGAGSGTPNKEWYRLCGKCHRNLEEDTLHTHPEDMDLDGSGMADCHTCHGTMPGTTYRICSECHYHNNNDIDEYPYSELLF